MKNLTMICTLSVLAAPAFAAFPAIQCEDANQGATAKIFMNVDPAARFEIGYATQNGNMWLPHVTANGVVKQTVQGNVVSLTGNFGTVLELHPTSTPAKFTGLVSGPIFAGNIGRVSNYPLNCQAR